MAGYVFETHRLIDDRQPVFIDATQIAKLPVRYSDPAVAALFGGGAMSSTRTDVTIDGAYLLIKW